MIGFIIGLFIGVFAGFTVAAFCVAASEADEYRKGKK